MQVEGTIKVIGEIQTFGEKGFRKREVVVTTDEKYPQDIMVEFVQDSCDVLNNFEIGQEVTISINLRGREWTSPKGEIKYFNSINGWRIEQTKNVGSAVDNYDKSNDNEGEGDDLDLPF